MEDSLEFNYLFKYILVGDTSVGKSSLLACYNNNQFNNNSNPTMGV
jgi:GTPase SAR1 family protein